MRANAQFWQTWLSRRGLWWLVGVLTAAACGLALVYGAKAYRTRVPISVGNQVLMVEIVETQAKRERGLMWRTELPDDTGMLFVFDRPRHLAFWMKNTPIDLDIGFFGEDRRLQQVITLHALDLTRHRSKQPACYALEVRRGWYADKGVHVGARLSLPRS